MGRFINPDDIAFREIAGTSYYVDKTGLIEYTNSVMSSPQKFICNSRPRRFGKSTTADMLTAYYSRACDSKELFSAFSIGETPDFEKYLNKCNVIHLDIQWCMMDAGAPERTVGYINSRLLDELSEIYPRLITGDIRTAYGALSVIYEETGDRFVVIIDEWDVLIRDEKMDTEVQTEYINFLRGMFKGSEPTKFIQLAFLTGILPIKKIRTESALNNFDEFTMLDAGILAPYIGFTVQEVRKLCKSYHRNFENVKNWYDGYSLNGIHIYNPRAVVNVMLRGQFKSYWSSTGTYESIVPLIERNFSGLKTAIIEMLSGAQVKIDTESFQNDMVSFKDRDDIITLLIHLGYLGYMQKSEAAYVPNEELRLELMRAVKSTKWSELHEFEGQSQKLLDDTLAMDPDKVAEQIEKIHDEYTSSIQYNDENSLSSVLTIAYLASMQYYFRPVRELPAGKGFADFVYLPKPEYLDDHPALIAELKWDKNVKTAIDQIKEKQYPDAILQYTGNILLVGISYDKKNRKHECVIEKYDKT